MVREWLQTLHLGWLLVFTFSFLLSCGLTFLARFLAISWRILDQPGRRKIHQNPIPLLGGPAVYISFLLVLLISFSFSVRLAGIMLGATLVMVSGLIDDVRTLPASIRLVVQILASLLVIKCGVMLSFLPPTPWGVIGECVLTVIWLVGVTNAINFLDGMDGLAGGLAGISALCFFIIALQTNQPLIALLAIAFLGSCLGFLPYNFKPATIFLGDAGSTFIGFTLAGMAIMGNWAEDNIVALSVPVLVLGVAIFDMTFTTIMRIKRGEVRNLRQWVEHEAKDHFHHLLVDLGLRPRGAVVFIYFVSMVLGLSAIVLWKAPALDAVLLLGQASIIFVIIAVLMIVGKRRRSGWEKG